MLEPGTLCPWPKHIKGSKERYLSGQNTNNTIINSVLLNLLRVWILFWNASSHSCFRPLSLGQCISDITDKRLSVFLHGPSHVCVEHRFRLFVIRSVDVLASPASPSGACGFICLTDYFIASLRAVCFVLFSLFILSLS